MANSNCLEGKRCPECSSYGPFRILGMATFLVYDYGVEESQDHMWDDDAQCSCKECGFDGTLRDFEAKSTPERGRLWWFYDRVELADLHEILDAGAKITLLEHDEGINYRVVFEINREVAVEKGWAESVDSLEWLED